LLKLPKKYLKNCSFKINLPAVFLELEAGLGRRKIKAGKYFEISTFAAVLNPPKINEVLLKFLRQFQKFWK
jgi:hypothetical protein